MMEGKMVSKKLEKHKQHLEGKFSDEEYSHVEEVLKSAEDFLQKSSNILFFSATAVVFFLTLVLALVLLPFKPVLPPVLYYGIFAVSAFVLGILIIYFIHINPEFEKHHHLLIFALLVFFAFISVFLARLLLGLFASSVISGPIWTELLVGLFISIGFLIPYILYWVLVE